MKRRRGPELAGLSVAVVTPFIGGEVDYPRLRNKLIFKLSPDRNYCPGTRREFVQQQAISAYVHAQRLGDCEDDLSLCNGKADLFGNVHLRQRASRSTASASGGRRDKLTAACRRRRRTSRIGSPGSIRGHRLRRKSVVLFGRKLTISKLWHKVPMHWNETQEFASLACTRGTFF